MFKILSIEDADDTIEILKLSLRGLDVTYVKSLAAATKQLHSDRYSLVLLDLSLPDGNGMDFLESLRRGGYQDVRVICLTGKRDFQSKALAFAMDVDDFIEKPFDTRELRLRVDAKLRKLAMIGDKRERIVIGDLILSLQDQRLYESVGGGNIEITAYELRLLSLMAKTPNKVFTRDEILDRVWTESIAVTDRTVDVHVSNLRKKLRGHQVSITTVIGMGYKLEIQDHPVAKKRQDSELGST